MNDGAGLALRDWERVFRKTDDLFVDIKNCTTEELEKLIEKAEDEISERNVEKQVLENR